MLRMARISLLEAVADFAASALDAAATALGISCRYFDFCPISRGDSEGSISLLDGGGI